MSTTAKFRTMSYINRYYLHYPDRNSECGGDFDCSEVTGERCVRAVGGACNGVMARRWNLLIEASNVNGITFMQ